MLARGLPAVRAKVSGGVGYAYGAISLHQSTTAMGRSSEASSSRRSARRFDMRRSRLAIRAHVSGPQRWRRRTLNGASRCLSVNDRSHLTDEQLEVRILEAAKA